MKKIIKNDLKGKLILSFENGTVLPFIQANTLEDESAIKDFAKYTMLVFYPKLKSIQS